MASARPVFDIAYHPTTFTVGTHAIVLAKNPGSQRWTLTVDGALSATTFETEVEAWEAGIRDADRIDRASAAR